MALPVLPSFFHSRRSLRVSLKPPPALCAASPVLLRSRCSLPFSLARARAHVYIRMRHGIRVQVCTTRDSSTSSTIHGVRRSTLPRFNIQTICNNFAATITPFLLPVPLSYLPPDFAALCLSFSLFPSCFSQTTIFSLAVSLSFIPSPLFPCPSPPPPSPNSLVSFPFLSRPCFFHRTKRDVARTNTPTPRLGEIAPTWCGALYLHLPPCDRNHSKSPRRH